MNGIHIYQGYCPDEVNGPHSRDKNCPVCRALITHESEVWVDVFVKEKAVQTVRTRTVTDRLEDGTPNRKSDIKTTKRYKVYTKSGDAFVVFSDQYERIQLGRNKFKIQGSKLCEVKPNQEA